VDATRPDRGALPRLILGLGSAVGLILLYVLLPLSFLNGDSGWAVVVLLVALLSVIIWSFLAGLARLLTAEYPLLQGAALVVLLVEAYLLTFALAYLALAGVDSGGFTNLVTRLDAVYFATTVFSTVGFGDIAPVGQLSRAVVMMQQLLNLIVIGVLVQITARVIVATREDRLRERVQAVAERHRPGRAAAP
jgi:hypothetical protein